ncbi:hypothetical protein GCM10018962_82130 [Dactylosporangium matsuzakiense]|uniref:Uncharacterized protein n=1 Tax=Dactylosporangium matsuzakiense TaxID=53360 RepID=A0A9W6KCT3_9ACTN|nr:hypothetical protein GCM10017581_000300 [Dactylosporangium matsuzakiense]
MGRPRVPVARGDRNADREHRQPDGVGTGGLGRALPTADARLQVRAGRSSFSSFGRTIGSCDSSPDHAGRDAGSAPGKAEAFAPRWTGRLSRRRRARGRATRNGAASVQGLPPAPLTLTCTSAGCEDAAAGAGPAIVAVIVRAAAAHQVRLFMPVRAFVVRQ